LSAQSIDGQGVVETGEILVTARKDSENIMNVPAAVTVVTRDTLVAKQVTQLSDLNRLAPSLTVFDNVTQGQLGITMRGIPTVQGAEPSVAMVVDGIQTPGLNFFNQDLEGAQSIEVLRGPQGALYGRGAIAGVIVVTTRQPTNDFEGDARALVGNGGTYKFSSNISGPIIKDKLLFKLTGTYDRFGGLVENIGYDGKADRRRTASARGELLFKPSDRTDITLKGDYQNYRGVSLDWEMVTRTQLNDYSILPDYDIKPWEKRWTAIGAAKIEHETDFGTFRSISQYARARDHTFGDGDFTVQPLFQYEQVISTKAFNQDLRFTSAKSDIFNWTIGGFYQWRVQNQPLLVDGKPGGAFDGFLALDSRQYDRSLTYAAYAQAKLALGGFDFDVAMRYDIEKRRQLDRNIAGSEARTTFKALQPQASITRRFSPDFTTYLSYGRGFRSGGFNAASDVLVPRPDAPYPIVRLFPKETADTYELGFKSQLFDRRLRLNVAAFHTDFKNQQYFFTFVVPTPARVILTIPKSRVNGLEVEGNLALTPDFRLDFGGSIVDAKVKGGRFGGNYIANVYKHTFSLGGEYGVDMGSDYRATLRVDYQRLGPVLYDVQNTYRYGGTDLLSSRLSIRQKGYEFAVFGRNLLDVHFPAYFTADAITDGISLRRRMTPRTYGVELRASF
jgi:iron complex outermembrane recepter protein